MQEEGDKQEEGTKNDIPIDEKDPKMSKKVKTKGPSKKNLKIKEMKQTMKEMEILERHLRKENEQLKS